MGVGFWGDVGAGVFVGGEVGLLLDEGPVVVGGGEGLEEGPERWGGGRSG